MTGPAIRDQRKQNAARQRQVRSERALAKACRTCGEPAAVSDRTGLLTRQCRKHLDADAARKEVYVLPLQSLEALASRKFDLEYPLSGALP